MRHLVTVALRRAAAPSAFRPSPALRRTDTTSVLTLRGASAGHVYSFTAKAGFVEPTGASGVDEHFAADADTCHERHWLSCADVLYASRVRPPVDAAHWLMKVAAAYPGCGLAAAPLAEGGWAVLNGASGRVVFLTIRVPGDQPLLASCLHAWSVTGHEVRALQDVRVAHGTLGPGSIT